MSWLKISLYQIGKSTNNLVLHKKMIYLAQTKLVEPQVDLLIRDQFAFRPFVSTTEGVVDLLQLTTDMLLQHEYVIFVLINFTNSFDQVKHHVLSQRLLLLDMLDQIYNWMVDYFKD